MMLRACKSHRYKKMRELFDGYKHTIHQEYGRLADAESVNFQSADGGERPDSAASESFHHHITCRLIVNNVTLDDVGEIECRALNVGGMQATRALLNVHGE